MENIFILFNDAWRKLTQTTLIEIFFLKIIKCTLDYQKHEQKSPPKSKTSEKIENFF